MTKRVGESTQNQSEVAASSIGIFQSGLDGKVGTDDGPEMTMQARTVNHDDRIMMIVS